MKQLPKLVEITPEGRIVAALFDGSKTYGELKSLTGLSDRWLSKKLGELHPAQIIERYGKFYRLRDPVEIINSHPIFAQLLHKGLPLEVKARLIASEVCHDEQVVAVALFGSVAKGKDKANEESDIDLLIVTEGEAEDKLTEAAHKLMFKYDVPIEAVFLTYDDLIANLQAKTAFSLGLLEAYQVLYDRGGVEGILSIKKRALGREWVYDREAETWIQKRLRSTLKQPKNN